MSVLNNTGSEQVIMHPISFNSLIVGSSNPVKIQAVKEVMLSSPLFSNLVIDFCSVPSDVSSQPMTLEETVQGAKNRARNCFNHCKFSIGIESGLMQAPGTNTGMIEFCACAIFDGTDYAIGFSCGFELPPVVLSLMKEKEMELGDAYYRSGLTNNPKLGTGEGALGVLTNRRVTRKDYTVQSIEMALIQFENYALYFSK